MALLSFPRNDGFLKSIQNVQFKGESRDQVSFDSNGNGVGAYDITVVNTDTKRWIPIGNWVSDTSDVHDIPANASFLDINLTKLEMLWQKVFDSSHDLTSVCGKKCSPGHFMNLEERYPVRFSSVFVVSKFNSRFLKVCEC